MLFFIKNFSYINCIHIIKHYEALEYVLFIYINMFSRYIFLSFTRDVIEDYHIRLNLRIIIFPIFLLTDCLFDLGYNLNMENERRRKRDHAVEADMDKKTED